MTECTLSSREIKNLRAKLAQLNHQEDLRSILEAMSSNTRLSIITILKGKELSVCDIAHVLNMTISAVSHQLKQLRDLQLVTTRRENRYVVYALAENDFIKHILAYSQLKTKYP